MEIRAIANLKILAQTVLLELQEPISGLTDGVYDVSIRPIPKKRTLRQNRYLWALIGEICKKENGDLRDREALYVNLLKMSGAKYEVMYIAHDAIEELKRCEVLRDVVTVKQTVVQNRVMDTVYVFYGSSKMSTSEMADLIDTTLGYAEEVGIYTPYWEKLLKGEE